MKKLIAFAFCVIFSMTTYGQKVQSVLFESWTSGSWQSYMKQTNTYDVNQYITSYLTQLWDSPSSSWVNNTLVNYTNNGNGIIQQYISQTWDSPSSTWKNSERGTYTYNASDKPLTITYETYTGGSWQTSMKLSYTYDGSGYLTYSLTQLWDSPSSSWKNNSQTNYTNNVSGIVQQSISQNWDTQSSSWKDSQRNTYTYYASDKPLTITFETYSTGSWQNYLKQSIAYDGNGYMINHMTQLWDSPSSLWKNNSQINYSNNVNGTIHQYISQNWDSPSSSWTNSIRATYTYLNSSGIFEANAFEYKVFPNPCSEKINISLTNNTETKIVITNIIGEIISFRTFYDCETSIDVKDFPPCTYFIILERNNKISVTKFIKE